MLNYIVWDVNPEIFSFGPITLRWYGLLWGVAIYTAFLIVTRIFKHENRPADWSDKMFFYGAISLIIGARLGHCLFYGAGGDFWYYYKNPFEIFKVWEGGLSSHGGAIGLFIGMWLYTKNVTKKSYLYILDRLVIGVALGAAFIRLGNLMNSEIYGETTTLPWGFIFVRDGQTEPKHPTQIYEILYCLVSFAITYIMYWRYKAYRRKGLILGVLLVAIFLTRFLLEFIKNPQEQFEVNMLLNIGQLLSLPLVIWGIVLIIRALTRPAELEDFEREPSKSKKRV